MEIKNIHQHTDWFASYENTQQGKALILCQKLKIKQLINVITIIKGEIELTENPKEYSHQEVLDSIKILIEQLPEVSHTEGHFKWIG